MADDEDQFDSESALPNVRQEQDAEESMTETAVSTPESLSDNMDIPHGEQATNVKYAKGESQITEEIDTTPTARNTRKDGHEEVQEEGTLREIKEEDECVSSNMQDETGREEADKEKRQDIPMEDYEEMQGGESSQRHTSSSSGQKSKRCICC